MGRAQMRKLAAYWQTHPPGCQTMICSSLSRARETAQIVCGPLNITPRVSDFWRE
ncbi:histidine phosphatase family protein [Deinococcus rubellus]|uniref:Histidine phosphatase family protein n=1 Tax=Deinococcus rubellus TaxID=1889240 RepID=A0ABY5YLR4_9DEIO|nr:histidine phosphatase family protein [Deinococcus rubellus]UWX65626.1 histidine phosphatase family protein [Deinococcus rubellus]